MSCLALSSSLGESGASLSQLLLAQIIHPWVKAK